MMKLEGGNKCQHGLDHCCEYRGLGLWLFVMVRVVAVRAMLKGSMLGTTAWMGVG